ncbi:cell cycle exit and neuronal differentiation protein 1-like isoform X3 [Anabas testudineus]|uniref:cell cycle exit and neuronal differentiation protein 1-like isoform X3 n=1 Tax=Anabas testudineus TaxID=64144 RepID=UPI000E46169C|nr:cell cycle exit and neuronal differentiation protein 1-like isoform X3 [Anabas testudineus]
MTHAVYSERTVSRQRTRLNLYVTAPGFSFSRVQVRQHRADHIKTPPDQTTPLSESMEAKAKSGASAPKAASKSDKKEPAPSRKADPAPAAPEPEHPPPQDGAAEAEGAAAGDETATSGTDSLEHLKPFLIGGAVIAAGAILLGVLLLARRN